MKKEYKKILSFILFGLWFLLKALITLIFIIIAIYDRLMISSFFGSFGDEYRGEWSYIVSIIYVVLLYVVPFYLICWTLFGLKRLYYVILGLCLIILYLSSDAIPLQHTRAMSICAERGYVWDSDLLKCRDDCFTWNKQEGCVPLYGDKDTEEK